MFHVTVRVTQRWGDMVEFVQSRESQSVGARNPFCNFVTRIARAPIDAPKLHAAGRAPRTLIGVRLGRRYKPARTPALPLLGLVCVRTRAG